MKEQELVIKWKSGGNRPRILLDCDDVITNFLGPVIQEYNQLKGSHLNVNDIRSWDLTDYADKDIFNIFKKDGFFLNLMAKKYSISTIKKLIQSKRYDIYVVTACGSTKEYSEKIRWFEKFIPEFNTDRIISIKEKDMIRGDILVDDKIDNLDKCARFMDCIIYDMPSNRGIDRYPRIHSLRELWKILEEKYY